MGGLIKYDNKTRLTREIEKHLENIVHGQMNVIFQFESPVMIYFENNLLLYIKLNLKN